MGQGNLGIYHSTNGTNRLVHSPLPEYDPPTLADNLNHMSKQFPITNNGYFGRKGKGKTRIIDCEDAIKTSKHFYEMISRGGNHEEFLNQKGVIVCRTTLIDGSRIVYRQITSTEGSPAVEITARKPGIIKNQKIHFIERPTLW